MVSWTTRMARLAGPAPSFEFAVETCNFFVILGLDLVLLLFQLENSLSYHFHFGDLGGDLALIVHGATGLGLKLVANLLQQLRQAVVGRASWHHATMGVVHCRYGRLLDDGKRGFVEMEGSRSGRGCRVWSA